MKYSYNIQILFIILLKYVEKYLTNIRFVLNSVCKFID